MITAERAAARSSRTIISGSSPSATTCCLVQPQNFVVNPVGPEFRGTWKDPLTGAATIDDDVIQ